MVFALELIARSRYRANLCKKCIALRKDGAYQLADAAVCQAKGSVLSESVLPAISSFAAYLALGCFLDAKIASLIWNIGRACFCCRK